MNVENFAKNHEKGPVNDTSRNGTDLRGGSLNIRWVRINKSWSWLMSMKWRLSFERNQNFVCKNI
jgi:hypothetical protein